MADDKLIACYTCRSGTSGRETGGAENEDTSFESYAGRRVTHSVDKTRKAYGKYDEEYKKVEVSSVRPWSCW